MHGLTQQQLSFILKNLWLELGGPFLNRPKQSSSLYRLIFQLEQVNQHCPIKNLVRVMNELRMVEYSPMCSLEHKTPEKNVLQNRVALYA